MQLDERLRIYFENLRIAKIIASAAIQLPTALHSRVSALSRRS
jgi:hypothetical protein